MDVVTLQPLPIPTQFNKNKWSKRNIFFRNNHSIGMHLQVPTTAQIFQIALRECRFSMYRGSSI